MYRHRSEAIILFIYNIIQCSLTHTYSTCILPVLYSVKLFFSLFCLSYKGPDSNRRLLCYLQDFIQEQKKKIDKNHAVKITNIHASIILYDSNWILSTNVVVNNLFYENNAHKQHDEWRRIEIQNLNGFFFSKVFSFKKWIFAEPFLCDLLELR